MLNDLTMLLKMLTVSGCNEMDSERERHITQEIVRRRICGGEFT